MTDLACLCGVSVWVCRCTPRIAVEEICPIVLLDVAATINVDDEHQAAIEGTK